MRVVVDTSAAVKWFAPEAGAGDALSLLEGEADFIVPDVFPLELASALLRKERRGELIPGTARRALRDLDQAKFAMVPHGPLLDAATSLASDHRHGVYDCLFLLIARDRDAPVATFDAPMAALARRLGIRLWAPNT